MQLLTGIQQDVQLSINSWYVEKGDLVQAGDRGERVDRVDKLSQVKLGREVRLVPARDISAQAQDHHRANNEHGSFEEDHSV